MNISGFGLEIVLIASKTFPIGINLTEFGDDADALDIPSIQIADKAMGLNGDPLYWSKATIIPVTLNVLPQGNDDLNLQILADANTVAKGKNLGRDEITLIVSLPNGRITTFKKGALTDIMASTSVASAGRFKTKGYVFGFGAVTNI